MVKPYCKKCLIPLRYGQAFVYAGGQARGECCQGKNAKLSMVLKCPKCGYSISSTNGRR